MEGQSQNCHNSLFLTVLGHSLHTAVSTVVWRECHRTVRNRLLMTVLGLSFHTMFQPLAVWKDSPQNCH
ncbi:unnamed protein product [Staurois parvus]|uniref:Uncharacterized protein n=1 Tax=Staurois parvus TaxID=386267 RepID=A0ABN9B8E8_9NEOB|nr:unnamed protein product [Staurois parvus]